MVTPYNAILGIVLIFNSASIMFLGHLIWYHIYLMRKGLTTFEHIQIKLNKQNYKSKIFREVNQD
jgi:hypothetical protein